MATKLHGRAFHNSVYINEYKCSLISLNNISVQNYQETLPTEFSMCFSVKSSMIEPLYDYRIEALEKCFQRVQRNWY